MKDFVSRITFGFLMAQLFPGAVSVFAMTFAYFTYRGELPNRIVLAVDDILKKWEGGGNASLLFLTGLFVAFGMLIHGVHWSVLGMLERIDPPPQPRQLFEVPWHQQPIWMQLIKAPWRLLCELCLVGKRPGLFQTCVRENVAGVKSDWMKQHEFMQDFYLHTGQFFAHTAYALMLCILALIFYVVRFSLDVQTLRTDGILFTYGLTGPRVTLFALLYLGASTFFVLARVQLGTLFAAENELIKASEAATTP